MKQSYSVVAGFYHTLLHAIAIAIAMRAVNNSDCMSDLSDSWSEWDRKGGKPAADGRAIAAVDPL